MMDGCYCGVPGSTVNSAQVHLAVSPSRMKRCILQGIHTGGLLAGMGQQGKGIERVELS